MVPLTRPFDEVSWFEIHAGLSAESIGPFLLYMMGIIVGCVVMVCIGIPLGLVAGTWGVWQGWADGSSQWMRSPVPLLGAIWGFLALACLGVQVISWVTLPEASETGKESLWAKRSK